MTGQEQPGKILLNQYLKPKGMTQKELAVKMGVDDQLVNGVIRGRRSITPRTATLLAKVFKNTPEYWLQLQTAYNLWKLENNV